MGVCQSLLCILGVVRVINGSGSPERLSMSPYFEVLTPRPSQRRDRPSVLELGSSRVRPVGGGGTTRRPWALRPWVADEVFPTWAS